MELNSSDGRHEHRGWPDRAIGAIAAAQDTMITTVQLRGLGVSASAISRAAARGRLHPVHRGVYSLVGPAARPRHAAERAALLVCGPHAVLSHHTAAKLQGFRMFDDTTTTIHVTVAGARRHHHGLVVHTTKEFRRGEVVTVAGLAVTSVPRTVLDHGLGLSLRGLEHLIDQALRKTSRNRLVEVTRDQRGRPGVARIAALLDPQRPSSDTWSEREERLLLLIRRGGLPAPEVNVAVGRYVPDLLWREERVIVEYDSDAFHTGPGARRRDGIRHNELSSWGYHVIHVTREDLDERPEQVLVWIATALGRTRIRTA